MKFFHDASGLCWLYMTIRCLDAGSTFCIIRSFLFLVRAPSVTWLNRFTQVSGVSFFKLRGGICTLSFVSGPDRLFRLRAVFRYAKKSTPWSSAEEDELSEVSSEGDEVPEESEGWLLLLRFERLLLCLGVLENGGAALPFCIGFSFLLLRLLLRSEDERGRAVLSLDALLPFLLLRLLAGSGDGDTERLFGRLFLVLLRA